MKKKRIRPLAICVFRDGERILAVDGFDSVKGERFYRPLGGGIKFGESSCDAVAREVREEIGAEVAGLRYLGALENVFTCNGQPGHEIVMVYDGELLDRSLYDQESIDGVEDGDPPEPFRAVWVSLSDLGGVPLYPDGLLELLRSVPVG